MPKTHTCKEIELLSATHLRREDDLTRSHRAVLAIAEDECARGERLVAVLIALATMDLMLEDLAFADGDKLTRFG